MAFTRRLDKLPIVVPQRAGVRGQPGAHALPARGHARGRGRRAAGARSIGPRPISACPSVRSSWPMWSAWMSPRTWARSSPSNWAARDADPAASRNWSGGGVNSAARVARASMPGTTARRSSPKRPCAPRTGRCRRPDDARPGQRVRRLPARAAWSRMLTARCRGDLRHRLCAVSWRTDRLCARARRHRSACASDRPGHAPRRAFPARQRLGGALPATANRDRRPARRKSLCYHPTGLSRRTVIRICLITA